jgi:hypothetical protein
MRRVRPAASCNGRGSLTQENPLKYDTQSFSFLANKSFFMVVKSWKEIVQLAAFVDNGVMFLAIDRKHL